MTIAFHLEEDLRTRYRGTGTAVDTQELADGRIRELNSLSIHDTHVVIRVRHHHDHTADVTTAWRLIVTLNGVHEFMVEPPFHDEHWLVLRTVEDSEAARRGPVSKR